MKLECKFCHKKFDHELYSGLCPYCGRYSGSDRESGSPPDEASKTALEKHVETEKPLEKHVETEKSSEKRVAPKKYKSKIMLFILLFLLLVPMAVSPFLFSHRTKTKQIENIADTTVDVIEDGVLRYDAGSAGEDMISYAITVKTKKIHRDKKHSWRKIPKGFEVICVPYEIGVFVETGEIKKISELPEGEIWPNFYDIHMTPYAVTKDGKYLEAINNYTIEKNLGLDYEMQEEQGISDGFEYESGEIFFLVKKNEFKELFVNSYNYDEDAYQNTNLRGSYQVSCPKMQK